MKHRASLWLVALLSLTCVTRAQAHLSNPARLEIREVESRQFTMVLTLPVIEGRVVRARPVLPGSCTVEGDPEVRGTGGSVTRSWRMECNPQDLIGVPLGVSGLLGTAQEVQLTVETLDGRKHSHRLRPTQSFFVLPPPPTFAQLVWEAIRQGARRVLGTPELALFFLAVVFLSFGARTLAAGIIAFAGAQALAQWLGAQSWMGVSLFLPRACTALTAFVAALEIARRQPQLWSGWLRPLWAVMLLLGMLYGAAQPETIPTMGLSKGEQGIAFAAFGVGVAAGLALLALCARELRAGLSSLAGQAQGHWAMWVGSLCGVTAWALFLYRMSVLGFGGGMTPAVPAITLATCIVFALWCRRQGVTWLLALGAACFTTGMALSFQGLTPPLVTMTVTGTLGVLGATLLWSGRLPLATAVALAVAAMLYHGWHAGDVLRANTSLPIANASGTLALVGFLLFTGHSAMDTERRSRPVLALGLVAVVLAVLWRLLEYQTWLGGPVATELTMGLVRLPVLAVVLLLGAALIWPRRRRFQVERTAKPWAHWALLGAAFLLLPLGNWRAKNPYHTPRAPTAVEAKQIMSTLLSDIYLAFNVEDENDSFDRLAENVSDDLVADIYLDSRRRLIAGTRQGAEVTVKDVSVMAVNEVLRGAPVDGAFTYPCKWIVTARIKHWQHIHSRQNVYVGDLTIRVENERWKISRLELKSEERVVLSARSS